MSLRSLETKWKAALNSILEELTEEQMSKMLFNLVKIPQGVKRGKSKEEIAYIIIQYFGTEGSITVIDKEMKLLPRNDAEVQELLRPFVEKLKKNQQKNKQSSKLATVNQVAKKPKPEAGTTSKLATASGSGAKKQKLLADQLKSCQPNKKDPVGATKPKKKKSDAESTQTSEKDPVGATKPKKKKQDAESTQTSEMDPVGATKPKKKKTDTSQKSAGFSQTSEFVQMDPVGAMKPKQKPDSSLKPAESSKTSKVQSAVQTGRIKILRIKTSNKTNTHLEVEFNDRPQTVFVTTRLLANAFGFKVEDDFTERLLSLTAEAQIQGNKMLFIRKM